MLLEDKALEHWIDHFYGFGSWEARMWFITHEDGGGDLPEEVAEKLSYFYQSHLPQGQLADIREMYRHCRLHGEKSKAELFANLFEYRFGQHAQPSSIWKNLIAFKHGLLGEPAPDFLDYQRSSFVEPRARGEALIKLFPLPSPHNHAWYYSWLEMPRFPFLKSRALYQGYLFETRLQNILRRMREYKPRVVLMYGMENINVLKKSVQQFFPTKFKTAKAVKQRLPQYHRADVDGTTIIITTQIPTLRHNRVETGFDWELLGQIVAQDK